MYKPSCLLLLLCLVCSPLWGEEPEELHEFYFSYTDLNYNPKTQSLEIIMSLFIDDLDVALDSTMQETFIGLQGELPETDSVLNRYIQSHFAIQIDKQKVPIVFVGKETNINTAEIYLEVNNLNAMPKEIKVFMNVLKAQFDQQIQVLKLTTPKQKYTASITDEPFIHSFKPE